MGEPMIQVLIADSEPLARAHIGRLVAGRPGFQVLSRVSNAREAYEALRDRRAQLVFLDLELPDLEHFDPRILHRAGSPLALVLTSAQVRNVPSPLHLHAVDHLLKPFDEERFAKVMARAADYLGGETSLRSQHLRLLREFPEDPRSPEPGSGLQPQRYLDRLLVREGDRIFFLRVEDIDRIEDASGRSRVHAGERYYLVPARLDDLAARLDPRQFLSIRRSMIINLDRVETLEPPQLVRSS